MKFLVLAASLALVSARSLKIDQIEYDFCPDAAQPGTIDTVEVVPFPISLAEGTSLSILAQLTLNDVVPAGARVALDIKKEGLIPLPIPCLELEGEEGPINVGSCEYDADYLLNKFSDFLCPAHVPEGQTCATPLSPGVYGGEPAIEVEIPAIPDILAELIGAGTYYAAASINNPDGSQMTCIYVRVEVVA